MAPVLIGVAIVLGLCCGGTVIAAATSAPDTQAAPVSSAGAVSSAGTGAAAAPQEQQKPALPGLRQPVRDGKFEFVVDTVECGSKTLGEGAFASKAQGEYCVVSLSVKNIGDEAQMFSGSNQVAFNAAGQKFQSDGGATIFLADTNSFLEDINPGNSVDGIVVFDVAPGTVLTRLELHDSAWSGGVEVGIA